MLSSTGAIPVTGARRLTAIKKTPSIRIIEEKVVRLVGVEYKTYITKSMAGDAIIPEQALPLY